MKKINAGCSFTKTLAANDSTPLKAKLTQGCTLLLVLLASLFLPSCNSEQIAPPAKIGSVYVLNEGQYMAGNGSLTVYDPNTDEVVGDIFTKANGVAFGDTPTSMTTIGGRSFIPISGSGKIYVLEPKTGKMIGKIIELDSPRYIIEISEEKAYVSNLWIAQIDIINPKTLEKIGSIDLGGTAGAEKFIRRGNYIYTNIWSSGTEIIKIDITQGKVVDRLEVGIQPVTIVEDKYGKLWTLTDGGGWEENPIGYEEPAIVRIDPTTFKVEQKWNFPRNGVMYSMVVSADGESVLFLNNDVYKMSVKANTIPTEPFIKYTGSYYGFYSMGINPQNSDIYISDALDFMQNGRVARYNANGKLIIDFKVGLIPGAFGFVKE